MTWLTTATSFEVPTSHGPLPGYALVAGARLYRIFRHQPDGDWVSPPAHLRTGRVDPPVASPGAFGLLYTSDSIVTAGFEAQILRPTKDASGNNTVELIDEPVDPASGVPIKQPPFEAAHATTAAVAFVDIEAPELAAVTGIHIGAPVPRISKWRELSHWVHRELISKGDGSALIPLIGITWVSTIKDCTGRNFAIFEERRDAHLARAAAPTDRRPLDRIELQRLWSIA